MKTDDIKSYTDELQTRMKEQLGSVGEEQLAPMPAATRSLAIIKGMIDELRDFVYQYRFQNATEEIVFFKEIKPVFFSQFYYHEKVFTLKLNEPFASAEQQVEYYKEALREIQVFTNSNYEFYRYCLSNSLYFDDKYFLRSSNGIKGIEVDNKFSTGHDNLLAMILANQLLKDYILQTLDKIEHGGDGIRPSLTWTAPKTSLIELIYALYYSDAFNDGNTDIKKIAIVFENHFNVSLGNYYRVFQDIRLRKKGQAVFLDQLKEKLIKSIEERD